MSETAPKILELGGGANRQPFSTCNVDVRSAPGVDFTADFDKPLPIQSDEWDVVFSQYCLEHISWRNLPSFLKEVHRILKPNGRVVLVTANTEAQIQWIKDNPEGWDGKSAFESYSCVLMGDQDYSDNTHKVYLSPALLTNLLQEAGFVDIITQPYGARNTDMTVDARKPSPNEEPLVIPNVLGSKVVPTNPATEEPKPVVVNADKPIGAFEQPPAPPKNPLDGIPRAELFDKAYFNGGGKVGGYAREGFRDFPVHEITARHILTRKPESVLEVGCARGYILKRIQDAGVRGYGIEISKHCYMTRVCEGISNFDICDRVWCIDTHPTDPSYDLCYSVATLEHIPAEALPDVIRNMKTHSKRGLHGIDFGGHDDGFDKTHCTLMPKAWWEEQFARYAPNWPVEIVDKEELEKSADGFPTEVLRGDGKLKLNLGSFTSMFHHGWTNVDVHDLAGYAQANGYGYLRHDVRQGLPFGTGVVDLIFAHHMLEHLTYAEGVSLLREMRRVIRPDGAVRIVVPNAEHLMRLYCEQGAADVDDPQTLSGFDEINDGAAAASTKAGKLWALLHEGHQSCYDNETLCKALNEAGFIARQSEFRKNAFVGNKSVDQLLRETTEMTLGGLSLFVDAIPALA